MRKRRDASIKSDTFEIPGKTNFLAYAIITVTLFTLVLSLILAFFPPAHLHYLEDKIKYVVILIISNLCLLLASYFFFSYKTGKSTIINSKKTTSNI